MKKLLLVGATGLVGQAVLRRALADTRVGKVVAVTRRPLPSRTKLENPVVDFDALPEDAAWWQVDGVICSLGTTMRKAGSKEAFRRVDVTYPLEVARRARAHGARSFALTSSLGADPDSRSFYLCAKAETERELDKIGFSSLTLVRPSLLVGNRAEFRLGERLAAVALKGLRPFVPSRYRPIPVERVAKALLEGALAEKQGRRVLESEEL